MVSVLKLPFDNNAGNLIWMPPYLYPSDHLKNGINSLTEKGYWMSLFPEGDGITFTHRNLPVEHVYDDFCRAFSWMNIRLYKKEDEFNYEEDILKYQIIILPVSRLEISEAIINENICLFPAGHFNLHKIVLKNVSGNDFQSKKSGNLRDYITEISKVDLEAFTKLPVIVFKDDICLEEYLKLTHQDDNELIKKYSERADFLLDLMRFYRCDYNVPEFCPARPGIWNDRYSAALVYFPKYQSGFMQAREVELKTFIKGIGMDFDQIDLINSHPLFHLQIQEVGNIAHHALKLNTQINEADTTTMKFIQCMILFEYVGNPNSFENFKKFKGKLIACLCNEKTTYYKLSERFRFFSEDLRTPIIHTGKRLEDLMTSEAERKKIFSEIQQYIYKLINDLFINADLSWTEYEKIRKEKQSHILK